MNEWQHRDVTWQSWDAQPRHLPQNPVLLMVLKLHWERQFTSESPGGGGHLWKCRFLVLWGIKARRDGNWGSSLESPTQLTHWLSSLLNVTRDLPASAGSESGIWSSLLTLNCDSNAHSPDDCLLFLTLSFSNQKLFAERTPMSNCAYVPWLQFPNSRFSVSCRLSLSVFLSVNGG